MKIEERFLDLDRQRNQHLERARSHARLSLPSLLPDTGSMETVILPIPYSSRTARNTLLASSKLTSFTFPVNNVLFFSLAGSTETVQTLERQQLAVFEEELRKFERDILDVLYASNLREMLYLAYQHLLVCADVVIHQNGLDDFSLYRLDQFVLRRSGERVVELCLRDWLDTETLEDNLKSINGGVPNTKDTNGKTPQRRIEPFYTHLVWDPDQRVYHVTTEFRGHVIEQGKTYKEDSFPYYVLGWSRVLNEDYSRSLVEENIGDIRSLEALTKALIEGAAAASKGLFGVNPTGYTQIEDLEEAENWSFVALRQEDVYIVQADNRVQMQTTAAAKAELEQIIDKVFFVSDVSELTQDRVTAEQIKSVTSQNSEGFTGNLSILARHLQRPLIMRTIDMMIKANKISKDLKDAIQKGEVKLQVKAGLDSLGRQQTALTMSAVAEQLLRLPEDAQESMDWNEWAREFVVSSGLDPKKFTRTRDEVNAERQQRSQQELQQQAGQQLIQSAGNIVEKNPEVLINP